MRAPEVFGGREVWEARNFQGAQNTRQRRRAQATERRAQNKSQTRIDGPASGGDDATRCNRTRILTARRVVVEQDASVWSPGQVVFHQLSWSE